MRGRLFLANVRPKTALTDVLDVLTVIMLETPGEALKQWRSGLDRAAAAAAAQSREPVTRAQMRATWGLAPDQIEAHRRFHERMGGGPGGSGT